MTELKDEMDISRKNDWPSRTKIREEVEAFVEAVSEMLLDAVSPEALRGLYYKGSSIKSWESALDYVPEISDVDFHVWLKTEDDVKRVFGSMDVALEVQTALERVYATRVPSPAHHPRPQFVILNKLVEDPRYSPPPPHGVRVLHGEDWPTMPYDSGRMLEVDAKNFVSHDDFLARLPGSAIDKPGRLLWKVLRDLVFRVSPAGPRVIHVLGASTEIAWESNRTRIYRELLDLEQADLGNAYANYYLAGWRYFLSGWRDTNAGREAIREGIKVLELGACVGRQWMSENNQALAR
jgi:hypothetical protein